MAAAPLSRSVGSRRSSTCIERMALTVVPAAFHAMYCTE
jgi:hypothetical protein